MIESQIVTIAEWESSYGCECELRLRIFPSGHRVYEYHEDGDEFHHVKVQMETMDVVTLCTSLIAALGAVSAEFIQLAEQGE